MEKAIGRHRVMLAVVGVLVLAVLAGAVALWPRGEVPRPAAAGQPDQTRVVPATLTGLQAIACDQADPASAQATCVKVEAQLVGGRRVSFETTDPTGDTFRVGQQVKLAEVEQEGQAATYYIQDLERTRPILALAALFVVAVVAFGGWQGIRSLIGLAVSFAVIIGFIVPAILRGHSPVLVALVGAMAIMLASLYLSHGFSRKTTAAVVGTALALGLTAALTAGFVAATALTGLAARRRRVPASRWEGCPCAACCWPPSSSAVSGSWTTPPSHRPRSCSSCGEPTPWPASASWSAAP